MYERVLGPDHYEVAGVLLSLAGVTERAGEYEQAEALRARALRVEHTVLGHTHRTARSARWTSTPYSASILGIHTCKEALEDPAARTSGGQLER